MKSLLKSLGNWKKMIINSIIFLSESTLGCTDKGAEEYWLKLFNTPYFSVSAVNDVVVCSIYAIFLLFSWSFRSKILICFIIFEFAFRFLKDMHFFIIFFPYSIGSRIMWSSEKHSCFCSRNCGWTKIWWEYKSRNH